MELDTLRAELVKEKHKYKCLQGKYNNEIASVIAENKRLSSLVEALERQLQEIAARSEKP